MNRYAADTDSREDTMTMETSNLTIGDVYRSNRGIGKYYARIIEITQTYVVLVHLCQNNQAIHNSSFALRLSYFLSSACGWVKA